MRLLWEENLFGAIGAVTVAAVALAATWTVLEGVMHLPGSLAMVVAALSAVGVLEAISRRHYADEPRVGESRRRSAQSV